MAWIDQSGLKRRYNSEVLVTFEDTHEILVSICVRQGDSPNAMPKGHFALSQEGLPVMRLLDVLF
jgi:hypothetical protein